MAEAGFYHQPTPNGDDRAMCFTCKVCLVCWEPADEPWYFLDYIILGISDKSHRTSHRLTRARNLGGGGGEPTLRRSKF